MTQQIANQLTKALLNAGLAATAGYKASDDEMDDLIEVSGLGVPDGYHLQLGEGYISAGYFNEAKAEFTVIASPLTQTKVTTARAIALLVAAVKKAEA